MLLSKHGNYLYHFDGFAHEAFVNQLFFWTHAEGRVGRIVCRRAAILVMMVVAVGCAVAGVVRVGVVAIARVTLV